MHFADFPPNDRHVIDIAIRAAETASRFEISVYRGPTEPNHRDYAERMHAVMASPDRSVLVMVNPIDRALEIVTGRHVRRSLSDQAVDRIATAMLPHLADDDFAGAIVAGLALLEDTVSVLGRLQVAS